MGFVDTITMILTMVVTTILGAVATGALAYVLIAYGIPMVLGV